MVRAFAWAAVLAVVACGRTDQSLLDDDEVEAALRFVTTTLPPAQVGASYDADVLVEGGLAPLQWSQVLGALPPVVALEADGTRRARLVGTPAVAGIFSVELRVRDARGQSVTRRLDLRVDETTTPRIQTIALPDAVVGEPYRAEITSEGGQLPLAWSIEAESGEAPPGLRLSSGGGRVVTLEGVPEVAGPFPFTVRVLDAGQRADRRAFFVSVREGMQQALAIVTESLPSAFVSEVYSAQIEARGGLGEYTWTVADGELPAGFSIQREGTPATTLAGRTNRPQTVTLVVRVADEANAFADQVLVLVVEP